jgi:hypothetical protein
VEDNTQDAPNPAQTFIQAASNGNAPAVTPQPSAQPADDSGNSPAPSPAASPQNGQPSYTPPAPTAPAATPHENFAHKFISSFAEGGSGSSASKFWRGLVGASLTAMVGAGAAENAPVLHGPYGDYKSNSIAGAASRGAEAGLQLRMGQQDRARKQQQQDAEQKRLDQESSIQLDDSKLRKAADARAQTASIENSVRHERQVQLLDQDIDKGNFDSLQRTAQAAQQQVAFGNALRDVGAQLLADPDGNPLQFSTHDDAEKAAHDNPKFFIGDFKTRTVYDPSSNRYAIYRVPDEDFSTQIKDQQGNTHTVRMKAGDYLDYQTRQQNLRKGELGIQEAQARLSQMGEDRKKGTAYAQALTELDKVGDDTDKLSPSSRTLLYTTAAKGLEDALRAHTAAVKADDTDAVDASMQAVRHYGSVLGRLNGTPKPAAAQGSGAAPNGMVQMQLSNGKVGNVPAAQVDVFLKNNPGAKQLGTGASQAATSGGSISIQLPDGSSIQSSPENVGRYLNSNKGAKVSDADARRFQQWSTQKQKEDEEDSAAATVNLQD